MTISTDMIVRVAYADVARNAAGQRLRQGSEGARGELALARQLPTRPMATTRTGGWRGK